MFLIWVEDKGVANRLKETRPNIVEVANYWESLRKPRRPPNKIYDGTQSKIV